MQHVCLGSRCSNEVFGSVQLVWLGPRNPNEWLGTARMFNLVLIVLMNGFWSAQDVWAQFESL